MTKRIRHTCSLFLHIGILTLLIGCTGDTVVSPELSTLDQEVVANKKGNASHATPMAFRSAPEGSGFDVGTLFPPTGGSSLLQRKSDYVRINVNTNGLPEAAYTTWWVVFNNPAACGEDGCNGGDFPVNGGDPAVMASVLWSTGGLVGHDGTGHFRATLHEGDPPGEVRFGPGLLNAETAEIHYIIKSHGPASDDPAILNLQLTTFGGGCGDPPAGYPCFDPQVVVH